MYFMGFPWGKISTDKNLEELQRRTNQFLSDFEISLNDFEKKGDAKELIFKLKEAVKQFQKES